MLIMSLLAISGVSVSESLLGLFIYGFRWFRPVLESRPYMMVLTGLVWFQHNLRCSSTRADLVCMHGLDGFEPVVPLIYGVPRSRRFQMTLRSSAAAAAPRLMSRLKEEVDSELGVCAGALECGGDDDQPEDRRLALEDLLMAAQRCAKMSPGNRPSLCMGAEVVISDMSLMLLPFVSSA